MIRGRVSSAREIIVPLELGKGDGRFEAIEAVLDTGYSGSLTLPSHIVGCLGLEQISRINVTLGDNVHRRLNARRGFLIWHDRLRAIPVLEASGPPLLGMRLLAGCQLTAQIRNEGDVLIEEL